MKKLVYLLSLGLLPVATNAQQSYTLEEAKKEGVENSAMVRNAMIDVESTKKRVWETIAIGLPQISGEANFQHFVDIPTQVLPANAFDPTAPSDQLIGVQFGTDYNVTASVSVQQLLFDGRYLIGLKAVRMFEQATDQSLQKSKKIAAEEVEEAYIMSVVAEEQVKVLKKTQEKLVKLSEDLQILLKERMIEATEVDQMELNIARLTNNLTLAEKQHQLATDLLKLKMGKALTEEIGTTDSLGTFIASLNPSEYMEKKFDPARSIDAQLIETQLILDEYNIQQEKAQGLPTLGAFFQTQQQALRNEFNFFNDGPWYPANIWGISLQVPIFSSGMRSAKVRQMEFTKEKRENDYSSFKEGLELQISNAKVNLQSSWDIFKTNEKSMEVAQRILDNAQIKLKEGMISASEFTQAENQFIATQSEYINAAFNALNAKLELDKLITE